MMWYRQEQRSLFITKHSIMTLCGLRDLKSSVRQGSEGITDSPVTTKKECLYHIRHSYFYALLSLKSLKLMRLSGFVFCLLLVSRGTPEKVM